jgi:hypothetical protein
VLNSLSSLHSRRNYKFAMEQFITWYCSEPRLALNRREQPTRDSWLIGFLDLRTIANALSDN